MKGSTSVSKPFQSRSTVKISAWARCEERLGRSKLKQVLIIDSDTERFMHLL